MSEINSHKLSFPPNNNPHLNQICAPVAVENGFFYCLERNFNTLTLFSYEAKAVHSFNGLKLPGGSSHSSTRFLYRKGTILWRCTEHDLAVIDTLTCTVSNLIKDFWRVEYENGLTDSLILADSSQGSTVVGVSKSQGGTAYVHVYKYSRSSQ